MDYTMMVNLLWDLGTGIAVGLLACGAWLCLEHRIFGEGTVESRPDADPAQPLTHKFS
ncbi:MAG TPA: hypothetical protein VIA19_10180 [Burkholderiales bacterium]|jgi:hypothetical protein